MLPEIFKKIKSNLNFISYQKFMFWFIFSIYTIQTFLKIFLGWLFIPCLEFPLVSSATLICKAWNISTFPMLVYYNIILISSVSHLCTGRNSSLSRFYIFLIINLFILNFNCFSIWLLPYITFLEGLPGCDTSISRYA